LIVLLCVLLAICATAAFQLGKERWAAIDPDDSGKLFAQQVFQSISATMPWAPPNGSPVQAWTNRVWLKFSSKKNSPGEIRDERDSSQN
jgi:hypothetical protein